MNFISIFEILRNIVVFLFFFFSFQCEDFVNLRNKILTNFDLKFFQIQVHNKIASMIILIYKRLDFHVLFILRVIF